MLAARGERRDHVRAAGPRGDGRPRHAPGAGALPAGSVSYRIADGVVVHLLAAVRVGDPPYYRSLSATFDAYDALLYELVKPKAGLVPGSSAPGRPAESQVRGGAPVDGVQ